MESRDKAERKRGSSKPLLRALAGEALERPPLWLMRQAGRYLPEYRALRQGAPSFLEFCLTPALAAEATLQPIRRFGMDGGDPVLRHPAGAARPRPAPSDFARARGRCSSRLRTREDAGRSTATVWSSGSRRSTRRCARVAAGLPAETALIGFAGAPWTVATYMVEGGTSRDFTAVEALGLSRSRRVRGADRAAGRGDDRASLGADRGRRRGRAAVRQLGRRAAGSGVRALGDRADAADRRGAAARAIRRCR